MHTSNKDPEDPKKDAVSNKTRKAIIIMSYMLCSSTMLIANKVNIDKIGN